MMILGEILLLNVHHWSFPGWVLMGCYWQGCEFHADAGDRTRVSVLAGISVARQI